MRKLLIGLIVFAATHAAGAEDLKAYKKKTQELQAAGKHAEALERHIWFFENAHDLNHIRLSFALSDWKELGDVYAPALVAMVAKRDALSKHMMDTGGSRELFGDVVALNRTLGNEKRTVELFESLMKSDPDKIKDYWPQAKTAVINAKRFDIAAKFIGNPVREFDVLKESFERRQKFVPKDLEAQFKAGAEDDFVEDSLKLIELAEGLDDPESAAEIRKQAREVVKDLRLRDPKPKEAAEEK